MLTAEQREEFEQRGFVRLPGAFARDAPAMEDLLWKVVGARYGARRSDPGSWTFPRVTGLQRLRAHSVFEAIGSSAVLEAIDDLLGAGSWDRPKHWGSFLVDFPVAGLAWTVPSASWHTDYGFAAPTTSLFGALVFSFLSRVPPRTGGTVVVVGSHRLVAKFVETHPQKALTKQKFCRAAFCNSDPWLKALTSQGGGHDRVERFMETERVISGIPVHVAELTGDAGDVILGHPWLLHTSAPNCGTQPRFMRVQRIGVERPGGDGHPAL